MSAEKENIRPKSRIPVLKEKALVSRVSNKNVLSGDASTGAVRDPLRVIASENVGQNSVAGSSRDIPVDTRYVTYRNEKEELDWKFEIFEGTSSVAQGGIPLPRDSAPSGSTRRNAITPTSKSVTKRVKTSLQRPHSIDLRNSSSPVAAGTLVSSPLFNHETKSSRIDYPHAVDDRLIDPLNKHYVLDNLNHLLQLEKKMGEKPAIRTASRACVVNWILKVYINSGNPTVVQQACWYLDKYLSCVVVTIPRLQVIAAACLWIATKFFGGYISANRLVKYSGHAFVENELMAAERHILRKLNFQAQTVVAQDFVPYFSWRCGWEHCADVETAATFICLCALIVDKTINNEYPSVVAAAAINISLKLLHMTECMERLVSCPIYQKTINKTNDLSKICNQLVSAVRVVSFSRYDYRALIGKYGGPPNFIVSKIFREL